MTANTVFLVLGLSLFTVALPADNANATQELTEGVPLPGFESLNDAGQAWKLSDHVGQKILVLYFYPGDFTGGCTRQAQVYRDELAKFEELGAEVVGVSGDDVASHQLFKSTFELKHTLLADSEGKLAKLLGMPVKAGGIVRATNANRMPLLDANGARVNINRPVTLARWTVVVGRDGKIASLNRKVDAATDAKDVSNIVAELLKK